MVRVTQSPSLRGEERLESTTHTLGSVPRLEESEGGRSEVGKVPALKKFRPKQSPLGKRVPCALDLPRISLLGRPLLVPSLTRQAHGSPSSLVRRPTNSGPQSPPTDRPRCPCKWPEGLPVSEVPL